MPPRQYQPSPLGPNQPSSRPERPSASAPPVLGDQQQTQSHQTASYLAREEQARHEYQYVEYAPYYPAPITGYEDERPYSAADPRAATFAAPPLARTTSLGEHVRNGLRRLGRALTFRRRRKDVVVDGKAYEYADAYDSDGAYYYEAYDSDQAAYGYGGAYGYDEAELERRRQRARLHQGSSRSLSRPPTVAEGVEENPPGAPVAQAVFFDGIVDRAGNLASPPPPPAAPVVNPPGPTAAARRRAKFSGDDDDLYNRTVGRDAESGVTYREARYK